MVGPWKRKWIDIYWESHLVHNIELKEAPLVRYQVENLMVKNWEILLLRYVPLMIFQV